jgi:enoyl-CoA hydratase/carnithine racemase
MAAVEAHDANDVLYITFNRPGKLNALRVADLSEVTALVTHPPDHIKALIFTGAGSLLLLRRHAR